MIFAGCMRSVGKQAIDESGKHRVNEMMMELRENIRASFRDGAKHQTSDAQLRIGESRYSGFDASHRPGMTTSTDWHYTPHK
jgi:hypothetical protein